MDELHDLYQQAIIDHGQKPHNFGALKGASHIKEGYNPLCGDKLTMYVKEKKGVITDVSFEGQGCAIFMASSSLITDAIKGKTVTEFKRLFEDFHYLVTSGDSSKVPDAYNKLKVMSGVSEFPVRVKCAILPWHTLKAALTEDKGKD